MEIRKERIDMNDKSNTQAMETEKIPRLLAQMCISDRLISFSNKNEIKRA